MRIRTVLFPFLAALLLLCGTARAQGAAPIPVQPPADTDFTGLRMVTAAQAAEIIDPLRVRLANGTIVQLAGIDVPDLTPYDSGPIGLAALALLRETLAHKPVAVWQRTGKDGRENRMGYMLAHLKERDGPWVQGLLLVNGLARVRPSANNPEMAAAMMALEDDARTHGRGLWADPRYALLGPDTADGAMNGWAIVEGAVHAAAMNRNTVYLNFGPDWRTDFTIGIPPAVRRALSSAGTDPLSLAGKTVRVHGWVEKYNGPYIELLSSVWMEILPDGGVSSPARTP